MGGFCFGIGVRSTSLCSCEFIVFRRASRYNRDIMNSDGSQKIIWKTASDAANASTANTTDQGETKAQDLAAISAAMDAIEKRKSANSSIDPLAISTQASAHAVKATSSNAVSEDSIQSLKNDIAAAFSGGGDIPMENNNQIVGASDDLVIDLDASDDALINESDQPAANVMQDNHDALVASLAADIQSDLSSPEVDVEPEETARPNTTGVGQTYYGDLTSAMGANDASTMSELIRKSRFEKAEEKVRSFVSLKNLAYTFGAFALMIASGLLIFNMFGKPEPVAEFIAQERVSSLVYSNINTGVNVTDLGPAKIKQAIREVIEKKIPKDSINQIYYVEGAGGRAVKRLGAKEVLSRTENQTPDLFFETLEDEFTHGVYKTDRSYPFIMLKTNSYDRALEGLQEWEPTMIDDLAVYFDLPPEATDRSLIQPGFESDLIKNKNVRVARFLPREVDRRGIFDSLKGASRISEGISNAIVPGSQETKEDTPPVTQETATSKDEQVAPAEQEINPAKQAFYYIRKIAGDFFFTSAYAQISNRDDVRKINGGNFSTLNGSGQRVCYATTKTCRNANGQQVDSSLEGSAGISCRERIKDTLTNFPPEEVEGKPGYSCISVATGASSAISQITTTDNICFDPVSGDRLAGELTQDQQSKALCFPSFECREYACFQGNTKVRLSEEGKPGVVCREAGVVPFNFEGEKTCRQFNGLLGLQNINDSILCFDTNTGEFLPNRNASDNNRDISCITPENRAQRMCLTTDNILYNPNGPDAKQYAGRTAYCFDTTEQKTITGAATQCADLSAQEIQQRLARAAFQLESFALISSLVLSDSDVNNMREVSRKLFELSRSNALENEDINDAALLIQRMERILNTIDPNVELPGRGPNGGANLHQILRTVIRTVKCALGLENNLQWNALERLPTNAVIRAGERTPSVEPLQNALVLLELIDPVSATGELDLVTQDALARFQEANGLNITGIGDIATLELLNRIASGQGGVLGSDPRINDFFVTQTNGRTSVESLALGTYSDAVQRLQILLYAEGYGISSINGLFDRDTCSATQEFQQENDLLISDDVDCKIDLDTLNTLDAVIREKSYLGTGFVVRSIDISEEGGVLGSGSASGLGSGLGLGSGIRLEGVGNLEGSSGPGEINFSVDPAQSDRLKEGDIVLMYMFLDPQTILIAREEIVIEEIVRRRALNDIFAGQ